MLVAISLGLWLVLLFAEVVTRTIPLDGYLSGLPVWALIFAAVRHWLLPRKPLHLDDQCQDNLTPSRQGAG